MPQSPITPTNGNTPAVRLFVGTFAADRERLQCRPVARQSLRGGDPTASYVSEQQGVKLGVVRVVG